MAPCIGDRSDAPMSGPREQPPARRSVGTATASHPWQPPGSRSPSASSGRPRSAASSKACPGTVVRSSWTMTPARATWAWRSTCCAPRVSHHPGSRPTRPSAPHSTSATGCWHVPATSAVGACRDASIQQRLHQQLDQLIEAHDRAVARLNAEAPSLSLHRLPMDRARERARLADALADDASTSSASSASSARTSPDGAA